MTMSISNITPAQHFQKLDKVNQQKEYQFKPLSERGLNNLLDDLKIVQPQQNVSKTSINITV